MPPGRLWNHCGETELSDRWDRKVHPPEGSWTAVLWVLRCFRWDITGLALAPGTGSFNRLEVCDNDSISGPKVGYSTNLLASTPRGEGSAAKEVERLSSSVTPLLDLLADQLEEKKDRRPFRNRWARSWNRSIKPSSSWDPRKFSTSILRH